MTITGSGNLSYCTSDSSSIPWKNYSSEITEVIIESGIVQIHFAFLGCKNLESVAIPNSVKTIGTKAFSSCTSLLAVVIPDSVTTIGSSAFQGCSSMESITISNQVNTIEEYTFSGCNSLKSLTIPGSVSEVRKYSIGCKNLQNLTLQNGVGDIYDYALSGCDSLEYLYLPASIYSFSGLSLPSGYSLQSIEVGPDNKDYNSEDGVLFYMKGTWLTRYPVNKSNKVYTVPSIVDIIDSESFGISDNPKWPDFD